MKKVLVHINGIPLLVKPRQTPADLLRMVGKPHPYYSLYVIDSRNNQEPLPTLREIDLREGEHFISAYMG